MSSKLSFVALVTLPVLLLACSGEDGAPGTPGAPGAPGASGTLSLDQCLPLGFPADGGVVSVSPAAIPPGNPCGSTSTGEPPQALTTRVFLSCG